VQFKDVTSTSFGLLVAFLLPGVVALFSLSFWYESAADAFHTFLTDASNVGLFFFLLLGALALGLVVSAVRWFVYEVLLTRLPRFNESKPTEAEWQRMAEQDRFVAFRAAVDETYRYHQFFGGLTLTAPALFAGWVISLGSGYITRGVLIAGFVALELLLAVAALIAFRSYLRYSKAILRESKSEGDHLQGSSEEGRA
jgi:hypothetical protein